MSEFEADGESRRGFLKCMTWAGTGLVWTMAGGVPASIGLEAAAATRARPRRSASCRSATATSASPSRSIPTPASPSARRSPRSPRMPVKPDFIIHTGDVSQLSKDDQFDDADQIIKAAGVPVFHVPGEHDVLDDGQGKAFLDRYGKGTKGAGWYSFDHAGVHFVALVNVVNLKAGGLGSLGADQLAWLKDDLAAHGPRRRSWSSPTSRSGRSIPTGAGAPTRAPRRWRCWPVRLGHRAERPHPPGAAEGGGPCHLLHRPLHRLPAAGARARRRRPGRWRCRPTSCAACSACGTSASSPAGTASPIVDQTLA